MSDKDDNIDLDIELEKEIAEDITPKLSDPNEPEFPADDLLLNCLEFFCLLEKKTFSPNAVTAGIPLANNRLTPSLFPRAAKKAGFKSKVVYRRLKKISDLVLPAVLILQNNQACIMTQRLDDGQIEIVDPLDISATKTIGLEELQAQYSGYAILLQLQRHFDMRAEQYQKITSKSWFWGTIWKFKRIYGQVILASLLVNLFTLAIPLFIMNVYDRVVPNNAIETLWALAIGILCVFLFDLLLRSLRGYLVDSAGQKIDVLIASDLFHHVLGTRMSSKPASSGAFASNLREFDTLREFFTSATLVSVVDVPFLIIFILVIAFIAGPMAWIPIIAVPAVIIAAVLIELPMRKAIEAARIAATQKHAILVESINALETIKTLSVEGNIQSKWEYFVSVAAKAGLKSRFFSSLASNLTIYIQQMVTVIMVIIGVYAIQSGQLSMGGLIAAIILSGRALAPLGQITNLLTRLSQSRLALYGLNEIMSMPLERPKETQFLHRPNFEGGIKFEDVSFSYPNQPISALEKVSFTIEPGEHVGIIGPIGAGKSTILKLVNALYSPSSGSVLIDNTDIQQIDPSDLRQNSSYVSQDSTLFFGTIRDNIGLHHKHISDTDILSAAKLAGVDDFVSRHPNGYDMAIGEHGEGISGGQRQAIALARAFVSPTTFLLLDEPSSSMDRRTEAKMIARLSERIKNQTVLLASHRASLLALVDRIIVIDAGKIVADGPKEQILEHLAQNKVDDDE